MLISILIFLLILSVLILVHELGHFIAARRAGVWVEEFGFGLPPRVYGKKIGETIYSLNLLPFGGFVRLHGENSDEGVSRPDRAFLNKSIKARSVIVVAGVLMNFVLGILAFSVVYSFVGVPRGTGEVRVVELVEDSPAVEAGLEEGEIIRSVDGREVIRNREFMQTVRESDGREVVLEVERDGRVRDVSVTPQLDPSGEQWVVGVLISDTEIYHPPIWQRPFLGAYHGIKEALFWGGLIVVGFATILGNLFMGVVPREVAGPAGLYVITSEVAKLGLFPLINWVGIISVNLAILNIFPIPALDGGRMVFIGIEKLFGRRLLPKAEAWLHTVSLGILLILILLLTIREVRMITSLGVAGYLDFLTGGQEL